MKTLALFLFYILVWVCAVCFSLVGFCIAAGRGLTKKRTKDLNGYLWAKLIAIDQSQNVTCQYLWNYTLIKRKHPQATMFGNPDETISSVLGKNKQTDTLSVTGRLLDKLLDLIDDNHSLNSIENV